MYGVGNGGADAPLPQLRCDPPGCGVCSRVDQGQNLRADAFDDMRHIFSIRMQAVVLKVITQRGALFCANNQRRKEAVWQRFIMFGCKPWVGRIKGYALIWPIIARSLKCNHKDRDALCCGFREDRVKIGTADRRVSSVKDEALQLHKRCRAPYCFQRRGKRAGSMPESAISLRDARLLLNGTAAGIIGELVFLAADPGSGKSRLRQCCAALMGPAAGIVAILVGTVAN